MSKLYLIPTPIGNLEDITLRALRLLKEVEVILAEDTRTSSKLLKHYDIHTPMQSYHLFNEHKVVDAWVQRIKGGTTVGLITDAGTTFGADRQASISRELTKVHEETQRGTLQELLEYYKDKNIKGEIVLVLSGNR